MPALVNKLYEKQRHSSGAPRCLVHFLAWCVFSSSILFKAVGTSHHPTCDSLPCQNEAVCVQSEEGYSCICRLGYKGAECEQVWLTEEAFVEFGNKLNILSAIVDMTTIAQLTQNVDMNSLKINQDQLQNVLNALNGPRFFTPWSSLQLSEDIVDSSYLQVDDKHLLAILTSDSLIHVFELHDQFTFVEIEVLTSMQARSLKGFSMRGKHCLAVARSSQALRKDEGDEAGSVVYCWNATTQQLEKFQDLETRGALQVEYISIDSMLFLVFACSRYKGETSMWSFVYVLSLDGQEFFLYQLLPTVGALRSSAVHTEKLTFLSVNQVDEDAVSSTKIFSWNGTLFEHLQNVSSRAGYVFAAGHCMFIISCGTIYRRDMDSKNFTFHSTLQGSHDARDLYEYFPTDNEHFLAVSHFKDNARTSLAIYRLNGFDFIPYQNVSIPSGLSSVKVFSLRGNRLVLAVIGGNNIELLEWKHM